MDMILGIINAPELYMMRYVLGCYLLIYILVLALSHIFIALRRGGSKPPIDRIVHVTMFWFFIIHTILPLFVIVNALLMKNFSSAWYFLPYGLVALINLVIIFKLLGKRSTRPA